jgi:D-alanine--poly(phosphoribitol) ligase subunit 1
VLALVLRHAHERPDHLALEDDEESLTYRQLAARTALVAAGISQLGVRPGDRVAVQLPNSAAFVTMALGCLWLGAPFVPLASDNPPARTELVLADCDPVLVVTGSAAVAALAGQGKRAAAPADVLAAGSPTAAPVRSLDGERDAYLIYTSGTTGKPKGVTIPERALRRSTAITVEMLGLSPTTRGFPVSSFHFDGSYATLFSTLVAGGALLVPKREDVLLLRRFHDLVLAKKVTLTSFSPSYLRMLVSSRHLRGLSASSLQTLMLGGEECVAEDVANLQAEIPGVRVFNRYGPTEATVAVTTHEVSAEDIAAGVVPLGSPHAGTEFFLVSEHGAVVSGPGAEGELYIGGDQLMRGYWGDAELTRKVLHQDVVLGKVLYQTGDLVYRDPEGLYVYRGRLDDVIKRNGVRISLTEVAGALRHHVGVTGAVCVLVDMRGSPGIAAFVEAPAGTASAELISTAGRYLPPNALPDEVIIVASLPMTAQGKVDHRRLVAEAGRTAWRSA